MYNFAGLVVQNIDRERTVAETREDGNVEVKIDGKVIDVIPKNISEIESIDRTGQLDKIDLALR